MLSEHLAIIARFSHRYELRQGLGIFEVVGFSDPLAWKE